MRVQLRSRLNTDPDWVWNTVKRSDTLHFIARLLIRFSPEDGAFPEIWSRGDYRATMLLFAILPIGKQTIGIRYPDGEEGRVLRDDGHGTMIRVWDHWIFIEPAEDDENQTVYTDRVDVDAGLLTLVVAGFARIFYAHRQRRWKKLARLR